MPYRKEPSDFKISFVDIKTTYCFGTCPVFEIKINKDGTVDYTGIDHVLKKGNKEFKIAKKDWDYIVDLINHLNIDQLAESYRIRGTDDQTGYLSIKYDDKIKEIKDYGMAGTLGLSILFDYMKELIEF